MDGYTYKCFSNAKHFSTYGKYGRIKIWKHLEQFHTGFSDKISDNYNQWQMNLSVDLKKNWDILDMYYILVGLLYICLRMLEEL